MDRQKRPDKHTDKSLDRYLQTWTDADRQTDSRAHTHTQQCNAVRLRFKVQHHLGDFAGDSSMTFQRIAVSHGNSWKLGQCCDCLQVGSSLGDRRVIKRESRFTFSPMDSSTTTKGGNCQTHMLYNAIHQKSESRGRY